MTDAMGAEWSNPVLDFTQGGQTFKQQTDNNSTRSNQPTARTGNTKNRETIAITAL